MLVWFAAIVAGLLAATLTYGESLRAARFLPLGGLRALTGMLVVALILDAPASRLAPRNAWVAVDVSGSVARGKVDPGACWRATVDSARAVGGPIFLFGDSLRADAPRGEPADRQSSLRAVTDRATGAGGSVVIVTDGEIDDPDQVAQLPAGSRVRVMDCGATPDMALSTLDAPRSVAPGDTMSVRVTLVGGAAGAPAGVLAVTLDEQEMARTVARALPPFGEETLELRGVVGGRDRAALLRAVFRGTGDGEPRNDTLTLAVEVTRTPAAVFVSTRPDFDAREAVAALRGVTSLPTRAWYRVAPGAWRADGSLAPVSEGIVRAALASSPVVVIHGDTGVFGAPRAATRGSLLLFAPPSVPDGEWFLGPAPSSPLSSGLSTLPLDSLPPLDIAPVAAMPRGQFTLLQARRGGTGGETRAALAGWNEPRHIAVLGASGFWRWRFRGGVREQAYQTLFGTLFDWLAAGRADNRGALPEARLIRAGTPIAWRRGVSPDSVAEVILRRRGATARVQKVTLRFEHGSTIAESAPLPPGIYDAVVPGGSVLLAVNGSRELVPRRPTVRTGSIGRAEPDRGFMSLRDLGWVYLLAVAALCWEWILRRREGLG